MIDFNDEKITEQEKQDFLTQQIDPEYKKKRQKFGYIPFQAGWIITYKMLQILNNEAYKNEGLFDFYKEDLAKFDPSMTCILFEGDLINEGEWDRFYNCWSKRDYIRCSVVFPTGLASNLHEEKVEIAILHLEPESENIFKEKICKYPNSWNIDGSFNTDAGGNGIIEFDPRMLKELAEMVEECGKEKDFQSITKRVNQPFWTAKKSFDKQVANRIKSYKEKKEKEENRRNQRRKRSKKELKKSFKKGFSL
tara:strand:+ start:23 stop:775 length:753 start_codon:yes stop_codon:yes gene_type:complete